MDALAFLDKAAKQKTQPIYALIGDEGFLVRRCRDAIVSRTVGDADPEYALAVYNGEGTDFSSVRNELETMPFLVPMRIVLIEQADPFISEYRESLEKYAAKPSKVGVLVLEAKTFSESTRLAKALPDSAKIACKAPAPYKLPDWCIGWASGAHSKKLGKDAAAMLMDRVGPQMGMLAAEIDKLATAIGAKSEITTNDVDLFVTRSREANVFRILDAIGEGKPTAALGVLSELFDSGENPLAVMGAMTFQLRKLAAFERYLAMGLPEGPAMDAANVPKWPEARQKFGAQVRHLGRRRLQQISQWLVDVNLGLKGGNALPMHLQVERLVVRLAKPRT